MKTQVLKCDCGVIFNIDSKDSIHTMGLKDREFRIKHSNCIQNKKYPELRAMPEFDTKRRNN